MTVTQNTNRVRIETRDEAGNRVLIDVTLGLGHVTIDAYRNGEARNTLDIEIGDIG